MHSTTSNTIRLSETELKKLILNVQNGVKVDSSQGKIIANVDLMVQSIVNKYYSKRIAGAVCDVDRDDLVQAGYIGVLKAVESYKVEGVNLAKFSTYAWAKIVREVFLEVGNQRNLLNKSLRTLESSYLNNLSVGIEPEGEKSIGESYEKAGITSSQAHILQRVFSTPASLSGSNAGEDDFYSAGSPALAVSDESRQEALLSHEDSADIVRDFMDALSEKERAFFTKVMLPDKQASKMVVDTGISAGDMGKYKSRVYMKALHPSSSLLGLWQ